MKWKQASMAIAAALGICLPAMATPSFPLGNSKFKKNYRKTVEYLYLEIDILDSAYVTLPTIPQDVQNIYYNDLIITYLVDQGCMKFRSLAKEWHPYTRQGITSGLHSIGATQMAEISDRLYRGDTSFSDVDCDLKVAMYEKIENVREKNEKLLWETKAIAWMPDDDADSAIAQLAVDSMQKRFPRTGQ